MLNYSGRSTGRTKSHSSSTRREDMLRWFINYRKKVKLNYSPTILIHHHVDPERRTILITDIIIFRRSLNGVIK